MLQISSPVIFVWAYGFADDIAIVVNGKLLNTVCELMQKALFIVQTWCRGVGLSVNETSIVLFTNNRKLVGFKKPILFACKQGVAVVLLFD
jgi:hypothetical protein